MLILLYQDTIFDFSRNMQRFVATLILLLTFLIPDAWAEAHSTVHSISRREGLSNGAVNAIVRDAEGYIWLGTWNGLNRYDGHTIETFLPGSGPGSIHNHVVREIYPSESGIVWMLTNRGIARYNNESGRFSAFFTDEPEQINYETDISFAFADGYGAVTSVFGRGLFLFSETAGQFAPLPLDSGSEMLSVNVRRVHISGGKLFCITQDGDLLKLEGRRLVSLMHLPLESALAASSMQEVGGRSLLFVTQRSGPAFAANPETGGYHRISMPDDIITSLYASPEEGMLWVGTEKGRILSYNLRTGNFTGSPEGLLPGSGVATRILCIYHTEPGILWAGTDGNGAFTMKLTRFPATALSSSQLSYPIVRSILVNRRNDMMVGTKGGGIDIFDASGKRIRQISVKEGLSNNSVLSFLERADGSILVGTDGNGIDILSPDYRSIRNFPRDFQDGSPLSFASVYRILEDSDGNIYLGTSGYGVVMIETGADGKPLSCRQLILDDTLNPGQQKQIVYALTEGKPGVIWIGTRGFGVYRYNTITKRVTARYTSETHPGIIRNDDILSLYTDFRGTVWAGSSSGLFCLLPDSGSPECLTGIDEQSGLPNASIHTIRGDLSDNLWVTTNTGLSLIDSSRRSVQSFNVNDGLINFEYSDGASYFDKNSGKLFVGGTMGVDIVQTGEIRFSSYFPPIAVNQLLIRNIPVVQGEGSVLSRRINLQNDLELKFSQNSFAFSVSPLAFWGRERHRISYRLLNFSDNWTILPPDQPVSFSNLEAGNYTLQLRVSDENGVWSDVAREIRITVKLPFWRTGKAIAGYIVLFLLIQILIFTAYRRREARRKEAELQEMRINQEKEMQSYKIEFFTNLAHEFRTPLTLITSHIHTLIEDKKLTTENPRLLSVYNNSLRLQKLVLEIMQFRKLEKGKEPLYIQESDPCSLIREVVSDLELLATQRGISCRVEGCDTPFTFNTDADKFQRIVTNLVSNAIKYNVEQGSVVVRILRDEGRMVVSVEDTGIGIEQDLLSRLFDPFGVSSARKRKSFPGYRSSGLGLAVTKGLVELLKGSISVESRPGKGTSFTCTFPDVHKVSAADASVKTSEPQDTLLYIEDTANTSVPADRVPAEGCPLLLVADDDPEILSLLRDFLSDSYNLVFAVNGKEALEKTIVHKPDLIVSDVMMPEMDGIELCRSLRDNFDTSHLPLILLTAKAEIEDRIAGLKAGADSYIPKPFHPGHLRVRIEKLLEMRQAIRNRFAGSEDSLAMIKELPDPFFQKMLDFIDENIDDETLSADKLCDRLAISRSSLYEKTKSVLGTTPHGMINQRRLSKAATLLLSTQLTVSEIIDQTGFASRTHFYDLFSKSYKCSPSEYRQRAGEAKQN